MNDRDDIERAPGRPEGASSRERLRQRMSDASIRSLVLAELSAVTSVLAALGREPDRQRLLDAASRELVAILDATASSISCLRGEILEDVAGYWPAPFDPGPVFSEYAYLLSDYPLTREAIDTEAPRTVSLSDERVEPSEAFVLRELKMQAVLMLPLPVAGRPWGLVEIYDARTRRFTPDEASLAALVVGEVSALLARFDETEAIERLYRETLASLANALEAKDRYTSSHAQEVVELALEVAERLGVSGEELRAIELGALLHDVGKIRVPESILTKPAPLSREEWAIMRAHTEAGEAILAPITSLRDVLPIVRSSHERWDGGGYPDGLRGEEIPLGARIVAVCDAYRAMVESRPYRAARSEADAVRELRANAGTQFDPACVRALVQTIGARAKERSPVLHRPVAVSS